MQTKESIQFLVNKNQISTIERKINKNENLLDEEFAFLVNYLRNSMAYQDFKNVNVNAGMELNIKIVEWIKSLIGNKMKKAIKLNPLELKQLLCGSRAFNVGSEFPIKEPVRLVGGLLSGHIFEDERTELDLNKAKLLLEKISEEKGIVNFKYVSQGFGQNDSTIILSIMYENKEVWFVFDLDSFRNTI